MWIIKPEPNASIPTDKRGYIVAQSQKWAEFVALRNKAILVENVGSVGIEPQPPFIAWNFHEELLGSRQA
jgi:hypothetical protein